MSSDSEDPVDLPDDGGDDLFGDDDGGDDAASQSDRGRALSDRDLASDQGDDYGGVIDDDGGSPQTRNKVVMSVPMYRHRIPKAKDGQVSGHLSDCWKMRNKDLTFPLLAAITTSPPVPEMEP